MSLIDHIPSPAEIAARRARMGWPQPKPVVVVAKPEPEPEPVKVEQPKKQPKRRQPSPDSNNAKRLAEAARREAVKQSIMTLTEIEAPSGRVIMRRVSEATGISVEDMTGDTRNARVVLARQLAIWLMVKKRGLKTMQAARIMGRDHSSVCKAILRIEGLRAAAASEHAP
jgi:hypothetical protein